ncbi:hypothetical protein F4781DRAFT_434778 [Annulohypoxylon bovei var. microspora]|nr:hypothetical protein F4781DRAFT_434778 [Annulohypoxylon bovei var. microspora]
MAELALGTIGAVASVVQLGDGALRLCRKISEFIGALKNAKDYMRYLRSTLDDISSLIRNLITYTREFQNATLTNNEHEALPEVVVDTVRHFHESLEALREWLPPDLSPSFSQKFRFVFNKKQIRDATARIEGCKTSTSLALEIVGRRNDIKLRNDLNNLRINSEIIAAEQRAASQKSLQQTSQLMTAIQNVSQEQSQAFPSLGQVDKRTLEIAAQLQSIHAMVAAQGSRPQPLRSTKTFTAVDEDTLAKLVRVCVTQTVQMISPGMDRHESSKVDDLSTNIASQAYHDRIFEDEVQENCEIDSNIKASTHLHLESSVQNKYQARRSSVVRLFRKHEFMRLRNQYYLSTFSPLGVVLSYTNSPDDAGYYNICPRILTHRVIPDDAPVWEAIKNDDVNSLQHGEIVDVREVLSIL